ncbi:MAG: hypothetical protein Q4E59_00600 [Bacteroidales bacterium]|nr:hypothetical protein [Bacteroidales bacterium]
MSYNIFWHKKRETVFNSDALYDEDGNLIDDTSIVWSDLNITRNLCDMFCWAFDAKYWVTEIEGKTGAEAEPLVLAAIRKMANNKDEAHTYDSPNGFGTYGGALRFLQGLLLECMKYHDMYLEIER